MFCSISTVYFVPGHIFREKTHSYPGKLKPSSYFSYFPSSLCFKPKRFSCEVPASRVTFIHIFDLSLLRHSDGHVLKVSEIQTIHLFKWVTGTQLHSRRALKDMVTSVKQKARNLFPVLRYILFAAKLLLIHVSDHEA